jgi:hypothetical protein
VCFATGGQAGIPTSAKGVFLNITAVGYSASGWLTLFPAGTAIPQTSNVSFDPVQPAMANSAAIKLGTGGQVCAVGLSGTNIMLDAVGYLTSTSGPPNPPPAGSGPSFVTVPPTTYHYDPLGNRLSMTRGGANTGYQYDRADRIKSAGLAAYAVVWRHRHAAGETFVPHGYEVAPIGRPETADFLRDHHYLHKLPANRFRFGLRRGADLVGIAVLGPGMPHTLGALFPDLEPAESVVLDRFALLDDVKALGETWFEM